MQLVVHQQSQTFIPIQTFRAQWELPPDFGMALFEPKDWEVGSMEGAGGILLAVKERVVAAVQPQLTLPELMAAVEALTLIFETELAQANLQIGLRPEEVDFAVSGFRDILQAAAFRLIQLSYTGGDEPLCRQFDYLAVYQTWLDDSVRVSSVAHAYRNEALLCEIRVIYNAYGRVGLEIKNGPETYYVMDMSLACPAASFMRDLCGEVAQALCRALTPAGR
jgi:hypothetical protein